MSRLNQIQQTIKELEGGRFQKLCDQYIYKTRNVTNFNSLGSADGTDKTTKGVPDTYYIDPDTGKYVLIMYGTAKDAFNKIKNDVTSALNINSTNLLRNKNSRNNMFLCIIKYIYKTNKRT